MFHGFCDSSSRCLGLFRFRVLRGKGMVRQIIAAISSGVPKALTELITLAWTLKKHAKQILAYFGWPGASNGPAEAINARFEHLRGSPLGFPNLINYITRSLLKTGGSKPHLQPQLGRGSVGVETVFGPTSLRHSSWSGLVPQSGLLPDSDLLLGQAVLASPPLFTHLDVDTGRKYLRVTKTLSSAPDSWPRSRAQGADTWDCFPVLSRLRSNTLRPSARTRSPPVDVDIRRPFRQH